MVLTRAADIHRESVDHSVSPSLSFSRSLPRSLSLSLSLSEEKEVVYVPLLPCDNGSLLSSAGRLSRGARAVRISAASLLQLPLSGLFTSPCLRNVPLFSSASVTYLPHTLSLTHTRPPVKCLLLGARGLPPPSGASRSTRTEALYVVSLCLSPSSLSSALPFFLAQNVVCYS